MKTSEEFLKEKGLDVDNFVIHDVSEHGYLPQIPISKWMIEFAKYHVEKSLEQASNLATKFLYISLSSEEEEEYYKKEILNAYNLENIK